MQVVDVYWLAGFLEGEGSFQSSRSTPVLEVVQVQKQPVLRSRGLVGGSLYFRRVKDGRAWWEHRLFGGQAAGVMMMLYPLMSPKRKQQIKNVLEKWKAGPGSGRWKRKGN